MLESVLICLYNIHQVYGAIIHIYHYYSNLVCCCIVSPTKRNGLNRSRFSPSLNSYDIVDGFVLLQQLVGVHAGSKQDVKHTLTVTIQNQH